MLVASGNPGLERIIKWLSQSWLVDSIDKLEDSGGAAYVMLDIKSSTGMSEMLRNAGDKGKIVRERVDLKMEESTRNGNSIIKGRQIVWMVCESFKCFDQSEVVYVFDHFGRLSVHNNDLHDFLARWNHILENMGAKLTSEHMRDVFFRKIQEEPELESDIREYEKYENLHPKKTYEHA